MTSRAIAAHPGKILLRKFLVPLDLSANSLALALRVPANRIGAIVKGERAITADTALRLARHFDTTPEFWMNLQVSYELSTAKAMLGRQIRKEVRPRGT
jgi:antitoxin HigA-1